MGGKWWGRILLLVACTAGAVLYVLPTLCNTDLKNTRLPFKQKINLGLDLQGGLYMVLGVDFNQVFREVVDRQSASLGNFLQGKGVAVKKITAIRDGEPIDDPKIEVELDAKNKAPFLALIKDQYSLLRLTLDQGDRVRLGLSREFRGDVREKTIGQSIEVIRNRIDEFGVSEPSITSQGNDRIIVELPGVKDIDRAKALIGQTAKLEWKLVVKNFSMERLVGIIDTIKRENNFDYKPEMKFSEYVRKLNEYAKGKIPEATEISFGRVETEGSKAAGSRDVIPTIPYLLYSKAEVTGNDLTDARVQQDSVQRPVVGFSLNPRGAIEFARVTGEHVHEQLAIVLDNVVYSAPQINEKIPSGSGQISLGRGNADQVYKEATDLALVLRAGALPAQLEFLEQRVVGPSLGQDSIRSAALASLIGVLAVFLFTAIYYRVSGIIAVFSLILNVLFVVAILVGMEATLTLPGIAGIALTVGIAVDSNVVIYERIREELRLGKSVSGSIELGFQKAFRTIVDANVTNALAATILLVYGTGPIKGFAVTMLIGIMTTLFTAVFVCKLLFDGYLKWIEHQSVQGGGKATLSI